MSCSEPKSEFSYKQAGVNIEAGNQFVANIKDLIKSTHRSEVVGNIGGFAGCFDLPKGYQNPTLVACTDGVGTKLKLAIELDSHYNVGIDLVAMCANDLVAMGAEPLFFLDYYATDQLKLPVAEQVIAGIADGCRQSNMSILGGETAEMPGMYNQNDYDLAGFCVGIAEKSAILPKINEIKSGDVILGLASSGIHSNGYSLVRKIIAHNKIDLKQEPKLAELLLAPTKIYVKLILELAKNNLITACAHITGGGLIENLPRVLPKDKLANINLNSFPKPEIYEWLCKQASLELIELIRTFNYGIGMALIAKPENLAKISQICAKYNEPVYNIGLIADQFTKNSIIKENNISFYE